MDQADFTLPAGLGQRRGAFQAVERHPAVALGLLNDKIASFGGERQFHFAETALAIAERAVDDRRHVFRR